MDLTNRVMAVGVALLWMFLFLVVILLAWGAPDDSIKRLADLAGYLGDHNNTPAKLIVTFGGLIFVLLGAIVVIFEVMPPQSGSVKVAKVGSGEASIGTDEIVARLEEELRSVAQVQQVSASVSGRGAKADVNLELHVSPEADLTYTSEEACRRARKLIEGRMGVELAAPPRAQLHYRELHVTRPQHASSSIMSPPPAPSSSPTMPPVASTETDPSSTSPTHEATEAAHEDRPASA